MSDTDLSFLVNFKVAEFQCHCPECADDPTRPYTKVEVMQAVQRLRDVRRQPLRVTRGVSCEAHNRQVGGAGDSRHLPCHADAVDIAFRDSQEAFEIVMDAMKDRTWTAYRVYTDHVHIDARPGARRFLASPE